MNAQRGSGRLPDLQRILSTLTSLPPPENTFGDNNRLRRTFLQLKCYELFAESARIEQQNHRQTRAEASSDTLGKMSMQNSLTVEVMGLSSAADRPDRLQLQASRWIRQRNRHSVVKTQEIQSRRLQSVAGRCDDVVCRRRPSDVSSILLTDTT